MSCKKKETPAHDPVVTPPAPVIGTVITATLENFGNQSIHADIQFKYQSGYTNAGSVYVNNVFVGTASSYDKDSVIVLSNPIVWKIQGIQSVPAQTVTVKDLPAMPISAELDTAKTLTASAGFTIHNQPLNCDSVWYVVANSIRKSAAGNCTSMTFSSAELAPVSSGMGGNTMLNVAIYAYNYSITVADNKRKIFISKTSFISILHYKP